MGQPPNPTNSIDPLNVDTNGGRPAIALYQADAYQLLPSLEIDPTHTVVLADPPYGIALSNHNHQAAARGASHPRRNDRPYHIQGDGDADLGLFICDYAATRQLPLIIFASPWQPWPGDWRNLIAWDKGEAVGAGGDPKTCLKRTWELIQIARNRPMTGPRNGSIWTFPMWPQQYDNHIAAKPVPLLRALIRRFTDPADTILDPCMGSGSAAEAAILERRAYIGVEIDPDHFAAAKARALAALQSAQQTDLPLPPSPLPPSPQEAQPCP